MIEFLKNWFTRKRQERRSRDLTRWLRSRLRSEYIVAEFDQGGEFMVYYDAEKVDTEVVRNQIAEWWILIDGVAPKIDGPHDYGDKFPDDQHR